MTPTVPSCPETLPPDLAKLAAQLARAWIASRLRPCVASNMMARWDRLIAKWIAAKDLPLFVRYTRAQRGCPLAHQSGRSLVPCDNSAAHWAYALALRGVCPTLAEIKRMVSDDRIPVAMTLKRTERERAKHTCTKQPTNLNKLGWKVCHVDPVGLGYNGAIENMSVETVNGHFVKYVSPRNMFLVPIAWSGIGEMPEMIEAARGCAGVLRASDP